MKIDEGFQQTPPQLGNPWDSDPTLRDIVARYVLLTYGPERRRADGVIQELDKDLRRFGDRVHEDIDQLRKEAEDPDSYPKLVQHDAWGRRVDVLRTSAGWKGLHDIAAEEGLISIIYERSYGSLSRVVAGVKNYLWVPASAKYGCPLSMADGAARVIELLGSDEMKRDVYSRLISRDPKEFWTAGQFMTERPGGSDLNQTETIARRVDPADTTSTPKTGDWYTLHGFKWFSSATDGDVAMILASTDPSKGSRGLSLFLAKIKDPKSPNGLNGIRLHRLKNKIGTKALPTAELELDGCRAQLVGEINRGVANISSILNITRIHSLLGAVAYLTRALDIAKAFAKVRVIQGGGLLERNALHTRGLSNVEVTRRGLLHLAFFLVFLIGRSESPSPGPAQASSTATTRREANLLRLLTPVGKTFIAVKSNDAICNCMEALGGQGYMEENDIGTLLRDGLVERIWEGTGNILSLDILRVISKTKGGAIRDFEEWSYDILSSIPPDSSVHKAAASEVLKKTLKTLSTTISTLASGREAHPGIPRALLDVIGYLACSVLLIEFARWKELSSSPSPSSDGGVGVDVEAEVARRWIEEGGMEAARKGLEGLVVAGERVVEVDRMIVGYEGVGGRRRGSRL